MNQHHLQYIHFSFSKYSCWEREQNKNKPSNREVKQWWEQASHKAFKPAVILLIQTPLKAGFLIASAFVVLGEGSERDMYRQVELQKLLEQFPSLLGLV